MLFKKIKRNRNSSSAIHSIVARYRAITFLDSLLQGHAFIDDPLQCNKFLGDPLQGNTLLGDPLQDKPFLGGPLQGNIFPPWLPVTVQYILMWP